MVGQLWARARVISLLGFPSDDSIFHINLPAARAGAVHPMGGAHNLVVAPARAVGVFPIAIFNGGLSMALRKRVPAEALEEVQAVKQMAHRGAFLFCGLR